MKDSTIKVSIGGKFAPLLTLDEAVETTTTSFNEVMSETADKILGKERKKTQPC